MPKRDIEIFKDIDYCFNKVIDKFKTDLKIKKIEYNKEISTNVSTRAPMGKRADVSQTVNFNKDDYEIVLNSYSGKTQATSTFKFENNNGSTILTYSEYPKGTTSHIRTLNYLIFELPIFSRGSKRRIYNKLENIKAYIEQ